MADETVTFRVETFSEFMRFRNLADEHVVLKDLLNRLEFEDIFYDIGANVGTYTCFAACRLKERNVIGFEPEPRNAAQLRENLAQNGLKADIFEIALSNTNGTIKLTLAGEDAGEGKHSITTGDSEETIDVETAKGDTFIESHKIPAPSVVKIDVEGAELLVLRGMKETLRDHCRLVYIEIHPHKIEEYGGTPAEVYSLLEEIGFNLEDLGHRGDQYFIRATSKNPRSQQQ
ncbi:FkbM family methyltransferase [Halobaculum sp. WSA2]|uniref:FkbM family methyltransferase n=1 Tax=Halobaculum saliterrae TaxID=2073113 RepID=A0A6B0SVT1_9EURY|nr:FkbM family methyltransferase [Halobaculum saliterrae]MXR40771.1 FkbM family methyltransferase [Halobaculum saliterrae]